MFGPFGVGQLNCAGQFLADYEGTVVVAEIWRRFRVTLACAEDEVRNCTMFVDTPRVAWEGGYVGLPVFIEERKRTEL